ncbi:unnamed protein product [Urochloa humidicola]
MRKRGCQASPLSAPSSQGTAVARGADPQVMVRRSRIAPCVTCGLCGGFLRDAAVIPDCLHPCKLRLHHLPSPPQLILLSLLLVLILL